MTSITGVVFVTCSKRWSSGNTAAHQQLEHCPANAFVSSIFSCMLYVLALISFSKLADEHVIVPRGRPIERVMPAACGCL